MFASFHSEGIIPSSSDKLNNFANNFASDVLNNQYKIKIEFDTWNLTHGVLIKQQQMDTFVIIINNVDVKMCILSYVNTRCKFNIDFVLFISDPIFTVATVLHHISQRPNMC